MNREELIRNTYKKQLMLNREIIQTALGVKDVGISKTEDFQNSVCNLVEIRHTKNDNIKNDLTKNTDDLITSYKEELEGGKEKGSKLTKHNSKYKSYESDEVLFNFDSEKGTVNGFSNVAIIALIVSFVIGFGIGIAYILASLS